MKTKQKRDERFWHSTDYGVGAFHYANKEDSGYCPDLLIVFVHGILKHYLTTWGSLPQWVLRIAGIDANVFSFSFPGRLWQENSIEAVAASLRATLQNYFPEKKNKRNIIFITHSAGGLVVKEMLRMESGAATKPADDRSRSPEFESLWHQTRLILHIDVPHGGGEWFLTILAALFYPPFYWLMYPLFWVGNRIPEKWLTRSFKFGKCKMLAQLKYKDPWLLELHHQFTETVIRLSDKWFPRPVSLDIVAQVPDIIANTSDFIPADADVKIGALPSRIELPGGHYRVKLPKKPTDPVVQFLASFLAKYREPIGRRPDKIPQFCPDYMVAERTASLTIKQPQLRVDELARSNGPPTNLSKGVSQLEAFTKLQALSCGDQRCVVLTGEAGLGKSSVLRSLARHLSCEYLAEPKGSQPLPVFLPFARFDLPDDILDSLSSEVKGLDLWEVLFAKFCNWGNEIIGCEALTTTWMEERLKGLPTVLILDNVDELLMNSRQRIGLTHIHAMVSELRQKYLDNTRLIILLGIRNVLPVERLDADDIIALRQLTDSEVTALFPWMKDILEGRGEEQLKIHLRNPNIASRLKYEAKDFVLSQFTTEAQIWWFCLEAIIKAGGLREKQYWVGTGDNAHMVKFRLDEWMAVLIFVGWRLFASFHANITRRLICQEYSIAETQWISHFREQKLSVREEGILRGAPILHSSDALHDLISRTVFVFNSEEEIGTSHEEFTAFLAACYLEMCVRFRKLSDLSERGFTIRAFKLAGQLLGDYEVKADLAEEVIRATAREREPFIFGNFVALVANSRVRLEGPAINKLLEEIANRGMDVAGRYVLLTSWSYRALARWDLDPLARILRDALVPELEKYVCGAYSEWTDAVTKSMAWCYLMAFHKIHKSPEPKVPWPGLGTDPTHEDAALPLVCDPAKIDGGIDPHHRSFQTAWLEVQSSYGADPDRPISALHYLWCLVVGLKHRKHIVDVGDKIRRILTNDRIARVIQEYPTKENPLRELWALYKNCQKLAGIS